MSSFFQTLPTELVEEIFLHLPMNSILSTQRVCQRFKSIIETSINIQQTLYLAEKLSPIPHVGSPPHDHYVENPLLPARFPGWREFNTDCREKKKVFFWYYPLWRLPVAKRWNVITRPSASWRQMFTTQPPVKNCDIYPLNLIREINGNHEPEPEKILNVFCEGGVRMGFLWQEMQNMWLRLDADADPDVSNALDVYWVLRIKD